MKFNKPIIEVIELNDEIICISGPEKQKGSSGNTTGDPDEEIL